MRAFLAVPVAQPALGELRALVEPARSRLAGVRWAPLDTAHLTLHFFGSVDPAEVDRAIGAVRPALVAAEPVELGLGGLGCFPSEARARVLWMGVTGDTVALTELAAACAGALSAAGFAVESRAFSPHCTLGRVRAPWSEAARGAWRSLAGEQPATSAFVADRAVLYESVTGPGGTRHLPRVTVAFGPSR